MPVIDRGRASARPGKQTAGRESQASTAKRVLSTMDAEMDPREEAIARAPATPTSASQAGTPGPVWHEDERAPVDASDPSYPSAGDSALLKEPSMTEIAEQAGLVTPESAVASAVHDAEAPSGASNGGVPATPDPSPLPTMPRAPVDASAAMMLRLSALKDAADVRRWVGRASDEDLQLMVRAVRELHSAWLHADASLINKSLEFSLLKQASSEQVERSMSDLKVATEERVTAAARLGEVERERDELRQALDAKESEVNDLTLSLQQAILENKGVAEAVQRARATKK